MSLWLSDFLTRQKTWSLRTFGKGKRTIGICRHIEKELIEIQAEPDEPREWVDVMLLAMDGYWRSGGDPEQLRSMLQWKQDANLKRQWPPIQPDDQPTEHVRDL